MNQNDQAWLLNRVHAALHDDFYLDREEEQRIKEEAATKGIAVINTERVILAEIDRIGALCERIALDELDRLLHRFTDGDKLLGGKEERNVLDKLLAVTPERKRGLDPRVAEEYVNSFCRVNGVRRHSETRRWLVPLVGFAAVASVAVGAVWIARVTEPSAVVETKRKWIAPIPLAVEQAKPVELSAVTLSDRDKAEIDDQLRRAVQLVERGQYTDPPEKSAKTCLDAVRQIDPGMQYRGDDVRKLISEIVDHYLALAETSHDANDSAAVAVWLERAKLMGAQSEVIRERERTYGISRQ